MQNFSHLLNQFIQRAGISDAELARSVGVSRQTIFRWREGLTARPRQREDVLVIARKLRLTPEECDQLLLAAGFRPEQAGLPENSAAASPVGLSGVQAEGSRQPAPEWAGPGTALARPPLLLGMVGLILVVGLATVMFWPQSDSLRFPVAQPGQTTLLITHFANYASSQVGYNVAGRLTEALQREIDDLRLEKLGVEIWPEPVGERAEALRAGQAVSATLVIYGEYDAGRVVVEFAHPANAQAFADPALRQQVASVAELSATINGDLPQQVRSLALLALGQIYLGQDQAGQARPLLQRARDNLEADEAAVDDKTWTLVNFYLGLAEQRAEPPDWDAAIRAYDQAVAHWPEMLSSRLNRIAAYEKRNRPGDLDLALADAEAVIAAHPTWAPAYNNRASIRVTLGGSQNLALALTDLEQALALDPALPEAYLNRAYARFGQGLSIEAVRPDVEEALTLRPGYGSAYNLLCWGYGLAQAAETALPFCEQAVAAAPEEALFRDSRGLALALRGDVPAALTDFEVYVTWLETEQPGFDWQRDLARRRAWIAALEAGQNPFTPELLQTLRDEFGQ